MVARIFLCHASEDKAQVREVYHRLRAIDGFEPWLDNARVRNVSLTARGENMVVLRSAGWPTEGSHVGSMAGSSRIPSKSARPNGSP